MDPETPRLDVVIVTYNSEPHIRDCLDSVFADAQRISLRVYVADNSSKDHSARIIRDHYPEVQLTERPSNDGFAVANNELLESTTAQYLLILNPDTQLESGTLEHLLTEMDAQPAVGIMGCRLITADGSLDHAAKRSLPSPVSAAKYFAYRLVGRTGSSYVRPDIPDDGVADVDAINGAFMLVRRTAFEQVGGFDEKYWMYAEDLDWCARFAQSGWRIVYDGRVRAQHIKGGSTNGRRPLSLNYHFHRSMSLFYIDHSQAENVLVRSAVVTAIWSRFVLSTVLNAAIGKLQALGVFSRYSTKNHSMGDAPAETSE